jgi:hypothetical protein
MNYHLDSDRIVETVQILCQRIQERFPDSGLSKTCVELHTIAKESKARCKWIRKPKIMLRLGVSIVILLILLILLMGILIGIGTLVDSGSFQQIGFTDFLQVLEAGMNTIILIGLALLFLITTETRKKRKRALTAFHQLRALAHVIDMHQLTKDPERIFSNKKNLTASSPRQTMTAFELTRYLDYCTEMLSLVGKIAALYSQDFDDEVVLTAVNDVETLTTGLSRKIWQKIVILSRFKPQSTPNKRGIEKKT